MSETDNVTERDIAPVVKTETARSQRLKESVRQKMLIDYAKNGTVPENYYIKTMKDGRIQFRRVKEQLTLQQKIEACESKLAAMKAQLDKEQAPALRDELIE